MNGLTAAKGLRRSVEQAGGSMRISVNALGDAFGRGKMTMRARKGIQAVMEKAGVRVTPALDTVEGDAWVTLQVAPPVRDLMPPRQVPPALAAAVALILPVLLASVFVIPSIGAERSAVRAMPSTTPLEQARFAVRAGEYRTAVRLTTEADPAQLPALRAEIVARLTTDARTAQRELAYVRAIRLARRAARYGSAPGAAQIIRQARAGLDLRRAEQRRQARGG